VLEAPRLVVLHGLAGDALLLRSNLSKGGKVSDIKEMARVNFNCSRDLKDRLDRMPWGLRSSVLRRISEMLCDLYERHGEIGLGAILANDFRLTSDAIGTSKFERAPGAPRT
jgi:hypothetical protein